MSLGSASIEDASSKLGETINGLKDLKGGDTKKIEEGTRQLKDGKAKLDKAVQLMASGNGDSSEMLALVAQGLTAVKQGYSSIQSSGAEGT